MDTFKQDLRYATRSLLRTRGFTAIVVATLALGIGANSAIFSVLSAVFFRPVPFPNADRVVNVAWDGGGNLQLPSAQKFEYWHESARSIEAMATWSHNVGRVDIAGDVSTAQTIAVTTDFFRSLSPPSARTASSPTTSS